MTVTPYADLVEAQAYFDERLDSEAWDEATEIDRLKALKQATRLINNLRFIGQKLYHDQENEFPRYGQLNVPTAIKEATCDLALQLLDGVNVDWEVDNLVTKSQSFAMTRADYDREFALPHIRAGILSSEAWGKLLPYLTEVLNIRLIR